MITMMSKTSMNRQRGIALIYVLLIFAMITLMASQMVTSLWLHTEKNARFLERIQAKHHALSAEQYVALLLEQDFEDDKKKKRQVDHERERWNVTTVGYPVEQGSVELEIVDENGRFNLNWLNAEALDGKRFTTQFETILKNLGIDTQLIYAIKDWIDSDQEPSETGAEDNHYLVLDPHRRTADFPLVSLSELRLIQGVGKQEFELLTPLVTVLPKESKVNVNSALPEVLRSLSDKITEGDAQSIIDSRTDEGFAKLEDMTKLPALKDKTAELKAAGFEFTSSYFNVYIKATYRDTVFYLRTLLVRNADGKVQVAGREIGPNDYRVTAKKES
ncbi:general secretion pathway protein K [Endozoicomonas montiporae CL-33]|nr:general secretion pathway protein K [Endozoicomonas montiporae CL-33]